MVPQTLQSSGSGDRQASLSKGSPRSDSAPLEGHLQVASGPIKEGHSAPGSLQPTTLGLTSRGLSDDLCHTAQSAGAQEKVNGSDGALVESHSAPLRRLPPNSPFSCMSCLSSPADSDPLPHSLSKGLDQAGGAEQPAAAMPDADVLDAMTRAFANGMNINDLLSSFPGHTDTQAGQISTPSTQAASPDRVPPAQSGWSWTGSNAADANAFTTMGAASWGGLWETMKPVSSAPASHTTQDALHHHTSLDSPKLGDQLLPSLLFTPRSGNAPAPNWPQQSPAAPASPTPGGHPDTGAAHPGVDTTNLDILSTVLEKLRPEELEVLAAMEPAQFEQVVMQAITSLSTPTTPVASTSQLQQLHNLLQAGSSTSAGVFGQQGLPSTQLRSLLQPSSFLPQGLSAGAFTPGLTSSVVPPGTPNTFPGAAPSLARYRSSGLQSPVANLGGGLGGLASPLYGGGRPTVVGEGSWEDLTQNVRDKVQNMIIRCEPHIKLAHFDGGVRHWLAQLTSLFGESAALAGLSTIEQATNLAGVRNMRAFITTRLIDCFEQHIFQRDPAGYAARRLLPEQYQMLEELINARQGLQWAHFDPKVLDTIRDLGSLEYTRARLSRLSARELAGVQNVPAYIFTLLSKRGKTAKQAAVAKGASEAALSALLDAALAAPGCNSQLSPASSPFSPLLSPLPTYGGTKPLHGLPTLRPGPSTMQRAHTLASPSLLSAATSAFSSPTGNNVHLGDLLGRMPDTYGDSGLMAPVYRPRSSFAAPSRSTSAQLEVPSVTSPQQQYLAAAQLSAMQQQRLQQQQQQILAMQAINSVMPSGSGNQQLGQLHWG